MSRAHILVVDDEKDIRELVKEILEDEGYEVAVADCGEAARLARKARRSDLILLDIWMPDVDGITLLKEWAEADSLDVPVIMISGHGTVETAVEATRLGAYDFLEKPLSLAKLLLTVKRALETQELKQENLGLKTYVAPLSEPVFNSKGMVELKEQIERIAKTDARVLIYGEAGTGKKVCAKYLHDHSARSEGAFVEVSVGSIAKENAAVELFGSEGSDGVHYGRLERANGGTLYIDDIGDMDFDLQNKLHGALQRRSFLRVGGVEPITLDARIIAVSQKDLENLVKTKEFREDLFYQLNVVPVHVPPLRERREEIIELLNHYLNVLVQRDGLPYREFTMAAQNRLRNYVWPGNIRELINIVQRLLILGSGLEISAEEVDIALGAQSHVATSSGGGVDYTLPLKQAREQFEKAYFEFQLRETEGGVSQVAKNAGVERTHLYRKLRALGINPKDEKA